MSDRLRNVDQAHEKPRQLSKANVWARRALAAVIAIVGIRLVAGTEFGKDMTESPSPQTISARMIKTVDERGLWELKLTPDSKPLTLVVYTGQTDRNGLPVTEPEVIHGNQIRTIEGQTVPNQATAVDVTNPGIADTGVVPLVATAEVNGQIETGILEPVFTVDGTSTQIGNTRVANGNVERNDQGVLTETGTGLTVDQITFVSPSAPTSSTH